MPELRCLYLDTDTGEIKNAQVFVAILGWSQYAYVEAMPSQTIEDFIAACENALRYLKVCLWLLFLIT
jgi:transposase